MRCEPATTIIEKLGGLSVVAKQVNCAPQTVLRWRLPKIENRGTGGTIPQRHIPVLLSFAKKQGVDLTANDFLPHEAADAA